MSHIIYNQNKLICTINISQEILKRNDDPLLVNSPLVLIVCHFQYPCVFFDKIFKHFEHLIPKQYKAGNIRLLDSNNNELSPDLPIGLFIQNEELLTVVLNPIELPDPYKVIKSSWKKAFTGINLNKGCDYIYKRLGEAQLRKRIQRYFHGSSHNLQNENFEGYEGTNIMIRFVLGRDVIQRKSEAREDKSVKELNTELFPQLQQSKFNILSHGVEFNLEMSVKKMLDEWSYNDGYCYLKFQERV